MAVIRSSSFGKARKSVGNDNYYRRAGVQLVRSKPTFAPDRQFTPLQIKQQRVMQVAQYVCLTEGLGALADFMNVRNSRKYNASSRYNRLLSRIMPNIKMLGGLQTDTPRDLWLRSGVQMCRNMSEGNMVLPVLSKGFTANGDKIVINFELNSYDVRNVLRGANGRRSASSQFTIDNFGLCGVVRDPGASARTNLLRPTMADASQDSGGSVDLQFVFDKQWPIEFTGLYTFSLVLFIAEINPDMDFEPLGQALFCTGAYEEFTIV